MPGLVKFQTKGEKMSNILYLIFGVICAFLSGLCLLYMTQKGKDHAVGAVIANFIGMFLFLIGFVCFIQLFYSFIPNNWAVGIGYITEAAISSFVSMAFKE